MKENVSREEKRSFLRRILLLCLYCLPAFLAITMIMTINYDYLSETSEVIAKYIDEFQQERISDSEESQPLSLQSQEKELFSQFLAFINQTSDIGNYSNEQKIWPAILRMWLWYMGMIVVLGIIPFLLLGVGFAYQLKTEMIIKNFKQCCKNAFAGWGMKFIISSVLVGGLLYIFHPIGIRSSTISTFIKHESSLFVDSSPIFLEIGKSPFKHILAGFWGWYLHLLTHFFYKAIKKDFYSTRIYSILFRKFLFVFGISIILTTVSNEGTLITLFFIGFFPLSALNLIRNLGFNILTKHESNEIALQELPGISRQQIFRFEEEGVHNIGELVSVDYNELLDAFPEKEKLLHFWIDIARWMMLLGLKKYNVVKDYCKTADNFLKEYPNENFRTTLTEKYQICNVQELKSLLENEFALPPQTEDLE